MEGWQAPLDGVVVPCLHQAIPLLSEGWQAKLDGVVFPSCGGEMTTTAIASRLYPAAQPDGVVFRGGKQLDGVVFPSYGGVSSSA